MTKCVHTSDMVFHLWAHQSQEYARNGKSSVSFSGNVLRSYAEPIGLITSTVTGESVAFVTTKHWSATTTQHQYAARRAFPGTVYDVYQLPRFGEINHARNLFDLVTAYQEHLARMRRALCDHSWREEHAEQCGNAAISYARAFGLAPPAIDIEADIAALRTHHAVREAKANTPAKINERVKRAARRAAMEERQREAASAAASKALADWRAGGPSGLLPHAARYDEAGGALLRIRDNNLETSLGAIVPLSHAIRVFHRVAACRTAGTAWHRNGDHIRVGSFQVDSIDPDGSFKAGCHVIHWPEIESAARVAGIVTTEGV